MRGAVVVASVVASAMLQDHAQAQSSTTATAQSGQLSSEQLQQGWRASRLLNADVQTKTGQKIGSVRNLRLDAQGQVEAVIVEGRGTTKLPEFVYRIPWERIDQSAVPNKVTADIASGNLPEYGLFPGQRPLPDNPNTFNVTEVIGDFARLQAGQGYGYVSDVMFARDGRMQAVLVMRDSIAGGGTVAFGFPGTIGRWNPGASYYGLPYVTAEQANKAALSVKKSKRDRDNAG